MPSTATAFVLKPSRDKILDAAETLFARRGFAGIGIAEVAEAVGLSKATLFHHFRSKEQLYASVMARIVQRIEADVLRAVAADGMPPDRLDRALDGFIDVLATNPTYPRLLLRSLFEDDELAGELPEEIEANASIRRIAGAFTTLLREGIDSGCFRPVSAAHMLQTLIGATVYYFASGEFGEELLGRPLCAPAEVARRKEHLKSLIHHGLMATSPSPRRARRSRS